MTSTSTPPPKKTTRWTACIADADANGLAGFGYEVGLMRRYQELAKTGASWLIVFAPEDDKA